MLGEVKRGERRGAQSGQTHSAAQVYFRARGLDYSTQVAFGPQLNAVSILAREYSAVDRCADCLRDRHPALVEVSVGVAPVGQPGTRLRSRLAMPVEFAQDLACNSGIITIGAIVGHLRDK